MTITTKLELERIRRDAREKHRKSLIAERAAAWSQEDPAYDWLRLVLWGATLGIAALIAFGTFQRFAHRIVDDDYTRMAVAECEADGKLAHVERAGDGRVLGVRCDRGIK